MLGRLGVSQTAAERRLWLPLPRLDFQHGLFLAVALVLGYFVLPPLVILLITSFQATRGGRVTGYTLDHYQELFSLASATPAIVSNTLIFGLGSAAVGVVTGTVLAWIVERTNSPFKTLAYVTAFVSFAVPGIVKVIGWILLLGPEAGLINVTLRNILGLTASPFNIFSMGGMILVEGLLWTPVVFLLMAAPLRTMDPNLEDAASASGAGMWSTLRRVTLPLALPSILSVLILTVIRSVESFEIPALIGIPSRITVLTTEVYEKIRSGLIPQYGQGSAYAVLLIVVVIALLIPYARLTSQSQRFATITGKGYRPRLIELGRWRYLTGAYTLLLPLLVALPLTMLLWASLLPFYQAPSASALGVLTLFNYHRAFQNSNVVNSLQNSLVIGIVSATAVTLLALFAAWVVLRTRIRWRWLIENLGTLPLVFPGVVLGIAILRTYLTLPIPVYGTIWIIVIAYVARYIPYGLRFSEAGLLQINRELEESGQISGASFLTTLRRIVVPLMMPALFGSWIYVYLLSVKELSVAVLLYGPQSQVISVTIWELWQGGQITELAAFCVVITVFFVAFGLFFHRFSRQHELRV